MTQCMTMIWPIYDLEGRAVIEAIRFRLLDTVESAGLGDMGGGEENSIMSIKSDELPRHEADELWRTIFVGLMRRVV